MDKTLLPYKLHEAIKKLSIFEIDQDENPEFTMDLAGFRWNIKFYLQDNKVSFVAYEYEGNDLEKEYGFSLEILISRNNIQAFINTEMFGTLYTEVHTIKNIKNIYVKYHQDTKSIESIVVTSSFDLIVYMINASNIASRFSRNFLFLSKGDRKYCTFVTKDEIDKTAQEYIADRGFDFTNDYVGNDDGYEDFASKECSKGSKYEH